MAYSKNTIKKIEKYQNEGFKIIHGNNPKMDKTLKWSDYNLIKICQTNSKFHGWSLYTVWALKKK